MRMAYLLYFDIDDERMLGVKKKINAQISSFKSLDIEVVLMYRVENELIIEESDDSQIKLKLKKGLSRYRNSIGRQVDKYFHTANIDYLYVRFPNTLDPSVIKLFRKIGKEKILLEIPTYPIKGEYISELYKLKELKKYKEYLLKCLVFLVHYGCTKIIPVYLNNIITFMDHKSIWRIKSLVIDNGVDTTKMDIIPETKNDIFSLTAVANVSKWHGLDRIIRGIVNYDKPIIFNIVGDGEEIPELKRIVESEHISGKVKFHGPLYGVDLNKIYRETNIAISSLGLHRIGLDTGSTIKTKEYCSLGIPFLYSYKEKEIDNNFPYALKIDSDDSAVNINHIASFYREIKSNQPKYKEEMHDYAVLKYDWDVQVKKIVDAFMVDKI